MRSGNLKYFLIIGLCVLVIGLCVLELTRKPPDPEPGVTMRQGNFDPEPYYGKQMPPFVLTAEKGGIRFPNGRNTLVLGVNREVEATLELYRLFFAEIEPKEYDLDIVVVTNRHALSPAGGIKCVYYDNEEFDDFFAVAEDGKFVLLVDSFNRIRHYTDRMIPKHDVWLLVQRFKIGGAP
jgi:hypothetical protein